MVVAAIHARSRLPIDCVNTSNRVRAPGCSPRRPWRSERISRISRRASDCPMRVPSASTAPSIIPRRRASICRRNMPEPQHPSFAEQVHRGVRPAARGERRARLPALHQLSRLGGGCARAQSALSRPAVSGAGAGRGAARSVAAPISRARQRRAAGHGEFLGRRRRAAARRSRSSPSTSCRSPRPMTRCSKRVLKASGAAAAIRSSSISCRRRCWR